MAGTAATRAPPHSFSTLRSLAIIIIEFPFDSRLPPRTWSHGISGNGDHHPSEYTADKKKGKKKKKNVCLDISFNRSFECVSLREFFRVFRYALVL